MSILDETLLEEYQRSFRFTHALLKEKSELPSGYLRRKTIKGKTYFYLQWREGSRVKSKYVSKDHVEELAAKVERRRKIEKLLKEQEHEREQIVKAVGRSSIVSLHSEEMVRVLQTLDSVGALEHVILIGSWAEYLYEKTGVLSGFTSDLRTHDVDFLIRNLRRPPEPINVIGAFHQAGYATNSDYVTTATKIYTNEGFEAEFLIDKKGAGVEQTLKTNLGVVAQSLRHLDILARFTTSLDYEGFTVNVPIPEAYVVHKMVINHERGQKQRKDRETILHLWPFLDDQTVATVVATLSKKETTYYMEFAAENAMPLPQDAAQVMSAAKEAAKKTQTKQGSTHTKNLIQ